MLKLILVGLAGFLGEALYEIVAQIIGEVLLELGWLGIRTGFDLTTDPLVEQRPVLAAVGYGFTGAAAGALSLALWPSRMALSLTYRLAIVAIAALAGGGVMAGIGAWRARHHRRTTRLATFGYGAVFALLYAGARAAGHVWQLTHR